LTAINWAPGKWWGSRGKIVSQVLSQPPDKHLFIGDTAMRPSLWPLPDLMRNAMQNGWRVVAGSDPLPFSGEETSFGRYGCSILSEWDPMKPTHSLYEALTNKDKPIQRWGRRRGTLEFLRRQAQIMKEKQGRAVSG
jgi:hypothetical protein